MLMTLTGGLLAAMALIQQTDTTIAVDQATRINVSNFGGGIFVRTWDRGEVRIQAEHSRRERIVIDRMQSEIRIRSEHWRRAADRFDVEIEGPDRVGIHLESPTRPSIIDYEITVPTWLPLILGGPYTDVVVEGAGGEVTVGVNEGDVSIRGGRGRISVQAVEGEIMLTGTEGNIRLLSIDGDVHVEDAAGDLVVETTDGEIKLSGIQSANVEAFSVDGDIWYAGELREGGRYGFGTHDGHVTLYVPQTTGARVTVATFDGHFASDFPVTMPRQERGHRFTFTLGSGGADVDIEAFDGNIELRYLEQIPSPSR